MIKRAAALAGSTIAGQLISLLFLPVITRIYPQSSFSDFAIYISISGIIATAATLRLETAFAITEDKDLQTLAKATSLISLLLSISLSTIAYILIRLNVIKLSSDPLYFSAILLLGSFGSSMIQVCLYHSLRTKDIRASSKIKAQQPAITASGQTALAFVAPGIFGLSLPDAMAKLVMSFIYFRKNLTSSPENSNYITTVLNNSKFIKYSLPASLINMTTSQIVILFYSSSNRSMFLAIYMLAYRISSIPIALISQSLSQSYISDVGKSGLNSGSNQFEIFKKYLKLSSLLSAFSCIFGTLVISPLFDLFFSDQWNDCIPIIQVILIAGIFQIPAVTISQTLIINQMNNIQFYWDLTRGLMSFIVVFVAFKSETSNINIVMSYNCINAILYIVLIILSWKVAKRRSNESIDTIASV